MVHPEGNKSQDAPNRVSENKHISWPYNGQSGSRGHLHDRVADEINRRHVVEVLALETDILLHAADIGSAVASAVDAEEKPDEGEVDQDRAVQLDEEGPLDRGRAPDRGLESGQRHCDTRLGGSAMN